MAYTNTTNLRLPIITTGTEVAAWGNITNNALTEYLDIAVAGGLAISITGADVTLTKTDGAAAGPNIGATTAQYAILNISGAKTAARNLNLPITSKQYTINNAGTGGFLLTVRGVTPTTGITMVDGERAVVAWNGTDYVKVSSNLAGVPSINGGQLAGLRNLIINGDCRVAQRGSVAATNNVTYGGADRIYAVVSGFSSLSGTIAVATAGGGIGYTSENFQYAQSIQSVTTTGTGFVYFGQRIEAFNTQWLSGKTITISAWVYQDTGSTVNCSISLLRPSSAIDTFGPETVVGASGNTSVPNGSFTKLTYTITLGVNDAYYGLDALVYFNGLGALSSRAFYITGFQLEIGPVATTFEQRPIGLELALCQRYLPAYKSSSSVDLVAGGLIGNTTQAYFLVTHIVTPRVATTGITVSSAADFTLNSVGGGGVAGTVTILNGGLSITRIAATSTGMVAGQSVELYANTSSAYILFTGCEL
jgi:hypothetical protein